MTEYDVLQTVNELMTNLGLEVKAEISQDGDFFCINMTGKDVRFLDHSRENRAGALITILKLLFKKRFDTEPRFVIDFNNQRKEKLQNVVLLARKKADMVRISGMEEEMPPMTPAERRAVHVALKEMPGIKTESRGVEPHRRIVIVLDENNE